MLASRPRILTGFTFPVPAIAGCSRATHVASSDDGGGVTTSKSNDAGVTTTGDASAMGDGCAGNDITFDLTVDATGPVYFGGPQPPWLDSFGCPSWLAISPTGKSPINVANGCVSQCIASRAEPAPAQSFTWNGTYYPACETAACAPAGNYVATICVGYAAEDGGAQTSPPTCKQVPFVWPPTSANQSIVESITPTPDGG